MLDLLASATIESTCVFLALWVVFRLVPSIPADTKAWLWRLAFLKPLVTLLPFAAITLYVLPAPPAPAPAPVSVMVEAPVTVTLAAEPVVGVEVGPSVNPLLGLWMLGAAVVAVYGARGWYRTWRTVRQASPVQEGPILDELRRLKRATGIGVPVGLRHSPDIESALLLGGFRPVIVLPTRAVAQSAPVEIRLMLAHEVAHIARRDLFWFGGIWIVQAIFFFNPMVWLAARRSQLDHESATDRLACQLAGAPVHTYAAMLLRATVVARTTFAPGVLPMAESYRQIHRRLEAMKHFNSKPTLLRQSAFGILAFATACLLPSYRLAEASPTPEPQVAPKSAKPAKTKKAVKAKAKAVKKAPSTTSAKPASTTATASSAPLSTPIPAVPAQASTSQPSAPAANVARSSSSSSSSSSQTSVSTSSSQSGSSSGGTSFSNGGEAQKMMEKTMPEFQKTVAEQQKAMEEAMKNGGLPSLPAGSNGAASGGSAAGGSVGGGAGGSSSSRTVRNNDGKEEVFHTGSSHESTNSSSSNSSNTSSSGDADGIKGSESQANGKSGRTLSTISSTTDERGTIVSYRFENFQANKALEAFCRQFGRAVQIDSRLSRRITVETKGTNYDQALRILLKAANAEAVVEDDTLVVKPKGGA